MIARSSLTRLLLVVLSVAALALSSCGGDDDGGDGSGGGSGESLDVGIVLEGPKNDKAFNEAAYRGVQKAVDEHPELKLKSVLENRHTTQEQTDGIEQLAAVNDIVIGTGAQFGPIFDASASKFPDTTFLTIGGYPQTHQKNVYSLAFDRLAAYPSGVVAAELSKSGKIGFVGGADIPPVQQSLIGVKAAVKQHDPSAEVLANIVGDFNDVAKAKAATEGMLADGADVIIGYVDAGIQGVYSAAEESGQDVPVFKLDLLECKQYSNIVGANIGDNTVAVSTLLGGVVEGTLKPEGVTIFAGLQDPSIQRLELCPKYAEDEKIAGLVEKAVQDLNTGRLKPPKGEVNPRPDYPYRDGVDGEVQNAG